MRIHSAHLAELPAVIVASERMDDTPHWREMEPGELLHVGPDLHLSRQVALPDPPAGQLTLDDLTPTQPPPRKPPEGFRPKATDKVPVPVSGGLARRRWPDGVRCAGAGQWPCVASRAWQPPVSPVSPVPAGPYGR